MTYTIYIYHKPPYTLFRQLTLTPIKYMPSLDYITYILKYMLAHFGLTYNFNRVRRLNIRLPLRMAIPLRAFAIAYEAICLPLRVAMSLCAFVSAWNAHTIASFTNANVLEARDTNFACLTLLWVPRLMRITRIRFCLRAFFAGYSASCWKGSADCIVNAIVISLCTRSLTDHAAYKISYRTCICREEATFWIGLCNGH